MKSENGQLYKLFHFSRKRSTIDEISFTYKFRFEIGTIWSYINDRSIKGVNYQFAPVALPVPRITRLSSQSF
jgi:hypothetical protein